MMHLNRVAHIEFTSNVLLKCYRTPKKKLYWWDFDDDFFFLDLFGHQLKCKHKMKMEQRFIFDLCSHYTLFNLLNRLCLNGRQNKKKKNRIKTKVKKLSKYSTESNESESVNKSRSALSTLSTKKNKKQTEKM